MQAGAVWEKSLALLKGEMTDISYSSWIRTLEPLCIKNDALILLTQNEISKKTLLSLYSSSISAAVGRASGTNLTALIIDPSEKEEYMPFIEPDDGSDFPLNPKYTFDSFVIGGSNNFAHAAAKAVADNPASAYNPLFIYGGVGLGKTHLMNAIGNQIKLQKPRARIIYVTSETFTNEMIQSIQQDKRVAFRNKYRSADVLMVDDIQFISGKAGTQEEFFNTFNALHASSRQIVLSSDRPPKELSTLEERLRSRFEGGLIADIQPPDLETRIAILKKKAATENVDVDEAVLSFIAERVNSNIRKLEGSLIRVIAYARLTQRPMDMALADIALKDIIPGYESRKITIELIQQIVADYYSVDIDTLLSQRRTAEATIPRHMAMYLCKEMTDSSLKLIGKSFGGRDHTTVINACRNIEAEKNDPETQLIIEDLKKRIRK